MTHKSQQERVKNLDIVVRMVATTMPGGAKHRALLAVLGAKYGFIRRTTKEYLDDLLESGRLVWDAEAEVWRLPET